MGANGRGWGIDIYRDRERGWGESERLRDSQVAVRRLFVLSLSYRGASDSGPFSVKSSFSLIDSLT